MTEVYVFDVTVEASVSVENPSVVEWYFADCNPATMIVPPVGAVVIDCEPAPVVVTIATGSTTRSPAVVVVSPCVITGTPVTLCPRIAENPSTPPVDWTARRTPTVSEFVSVGNDSGHDSLPVQVAVATYKTPLKFAG